MGNLLYEHEDGRTMGPIEGTELAKQLARDPHWNLVQAAEPEPATGDNSEGDAYEGLKAPQLKAELEKRGIEYPHGPVKNEVLRELLEAYDLAATSGEGEGK